MLEGKTYCPLLHSRAAEIKALFQLPAATKELLFPVVVGRPWPNAKQLSRSWDKVAEAFGGRRFALDLDRTKLGVGSSAAAVEFSDLFEPSGGFSNYYGLVEGLHSAIPVLRVDTAGADQLDVQMGHVGRIDRGLVLRLEHGHLRNPIALLEKVLGGYSDTLIVVDLGWSRDLLGRQAWASEILNKIVEWGGEVEVAVCGSSFPDAFTQYGARGTIRVEERVVYSELVRRHNVLNLAYGDWASTRPPTEPTPMVPVPRIDFPLPSEWVCFRRTDDDGFEESYADIARRLTADRMWSRDLKIWGSHIIECTASELPGAIQSPAAATSVRANIHMYRQAHFGMLQAIVDGDEPFTDD